MPLAQMQFRHKEPVVCLRGGDRARLLYHTEERSFAISSLMIKKGGKTRVHLVLGAAAGTAC